MLQPSKGRNAIASPLGRRDCLRLLAGGAAASAFLPAQQGEVFTSNTRLVPLYISITDKRGTPVGSIPQDAFTVLENSKPQSIRVFRREDVPVSLGLVVDNSGSMRDKRQRVEAAVLAMIKSSTRDDETFVVNFNDEAYIDTDDFTTDIKKLEEALTKLDARGGTAMRDALGMSIDWMKKAKKPKKVLLVITDGDDNTSSLTLERLVARAQQAETLIYALGILSEEEKRAAKRARRALDAVAKATGGLAYYPKDLGEVEDITKRIAQEIRNQYIVGYSPDDAALDGSFRRIQVKVKGVPDERVRTRSGYYATPDAQPPKVLPPSANTLRP